MAEKTVAVRLVALTTQYRAAMTSATAQTATFARGVQSAKGATTSALGGIGKGSIAGAAVIAAGAVTKLALDYDDAFTKIGAITNTSQEQVGRWREDVLALAGKTAQAPQDLADGLYFLASAGLEAADVMPTLEAAAQAAAIGMGDMGDLTRIAANVLNAFPEAGLKAADVFDVLTAAIREGTAEPDEFADALGRILPIASKADVEFNEIAASLSTLSNIGLDVNEGVTAMRGLLNAIVAPGNQAQETLDSIGLSSEELRRSLAEDGLIATLRLLEERTGGNIEVMRKIVPNIRAMTGAFGLTGQEAAKVDEIFRQVADSSGDLNAAFAETAESEGFQLRQALAELNAVAIDLGTEILPVVVEGLQTLAAVARNAEGPVRALMDGLRFFGAPFRDETRLSQGAVEDFGVELEEALRAGEIAAEAAVTDINDLADAETITAEQADYLNRIIRTTVALMESGGTAAERFGSRVAAMDTNTREAGAGAENLESGLEGATGAMEDASEAANTLEDDLKMLAGAELDAEHASLDWENALKDMEDALKGTNDTLDINTVAGRENREAILAAAEAAIDDAAAVEQATGSRRRGIQTLRTHVEELVHEAEKAGVSKDAIKDYIEQLNLTPKDIRTLLKLVDQPARTNLDNFIAKMRNLQGYRVQTYVETSFTEDRETTPVEHAGGMIGGSGARRMHSGGTLRGDERWFIGQPGERVLSVREWATLRAITSGGAAQVEPDKGRRQPYVFNVYIGEKKVDRIVVDSLNRTAGKA